ncbi:MAG: phospho-N-acetylmuramoyl-pentapeptide-transferase [Pirellulales bacterium]|nr:phospho-N-acetylmuramoyl-pentapeptide-transferase [Pirellulales bacterium]
MLLWLFERLAAVWPDSAWADRLPAFEKITLRASLAAVVSFMLAMFLGPRLIEWLRRRFREPIKCDSARLCELHRPKEATPTMGGLFLVAGLVGGVLLLADLRNAYMHAALVVTAGLAAVGAVDDLTKLRGTGKGLSARKKLLGQAAVATAAAVIVYHRHAALPAALDLRIPLVQLDFPLGAFFLPLAVLVIVGASNAVNLADGLDGLAGGCLLFAVAGMTVVAYAGGHAELAEYLNLIGIPGSGELTVLSGGMIGGLLGFLWFNCHPAQVFMGDTGSLPLGGLLGLLAVVTRQELLLVLVGGVFVAEAASVMLQVGSYKWRRRRVFLCAPLHHHFQFLGWPESRIVVRFWIASALCAILGLVSLKWNVHEERPVSPESFSAVAKSVCPAGSRTRESSGKVPNSHEFGYEP